MTELKTLKDIERICTTKGEDFILFCLRQEAIKWIKSGVFLNKINNKMLWYWCTFFNITEEDLK